MTHDNLYCHEKQPTPLAANLRCRCILLLADHKKFHECLSGHRWKTKTEKIKKVK